MNSEEHKVIDPVCGMKLGERQIRQSFVYKGRRYCFCSVGCLAEFQRHPDDYVEGGRKGDVKDV